ncbi:MAG: SpoIIE family protein phosphatase [Polyangiaceae bacterium]|jgi:DNA-binding LacI/PurR family transcriptional regulator/serine phosphatase RsbU (regulator of sigma subunit)
MSHHGSAGQGRRWTIAILSDSVLDEYQNTVLFGASDALRELGHSVVLFCGGVIDSPDRSSSQRNALYDLIDPTRIDGVIVLTPLGNHIGPEALSTYCSRFAPLPVCALAVELPGRPSVLVDNAGGMRRLLEHMVIAHAKQRIAFVRGPVGNEEAERRYGAYVEALGRHGIGFDPRLVTIGDFNAPSGAEAVRILCEERREHFDAVVAANDLMALGAMEALQARAFDVPRRVGVAGFDDIDEARFASPSLTTVRQPLYDSGRHAARILAAMLNGQARPERLVLDTMLVLRESCGCNVEGAVRTETPGALAEVASIADHLVAGREQTLVRMANVVAPEHARIAPDWMEALFDAFVADVRDGATNHFATSLDATLRRVVVAGGSVRPWHAVLSLLSSASLAATDDFRGRFRSDEILHRGRAVISDLRERLQAQHRIRRERWIRTLHETSEALMTAFGESALVEAVARQLPRLQIPACAFSVYEQAGITRRARPLFLYDDGRRIDCGADEPTFDPRQLAPHGWVDQRPRTIVAEPLVFHGEQLGLALFEVGPHEGAVYEGLRELISSALKGARLVNQVVEEATRRQRAERERLEKEMEIAARIQTTIVPKQFAVPHLDIAAIMIPATEVGGDYYDVIPSPAGCWIGIGDVAGHGLQPGLVMLMIQSIVAALVRREPGASPCQVYSVLNAVLYDNVHRRMGQDEHATLSLLRYDGAGAVVYAGAHEDIIVHRASRGECERFETRGPWVGAFPNVDSMLVETTISLEVGDVMILYTDGVTEGKDRRGVQFGPERMCAIVERVADQPVQAIRDHLISAVRRWTKVQEDDVSLIVVRRLA